MAGGEGAAAGVHVGHERGELRRVRRADVGRKALPRLQQAFVLRARGEREPPVFPRVAVKVRELDGGLLVVEAEISFLPRAERAVDDRGDGAIGKRDDRHRNIFDLDRAVERGGHRADFAPLAE